MDTGIIYGIGGILGTLSFGILSIYFYKKTLKLNAEKESITHEHLFKDSKKLKNNILKEFEPDVLFTPCRRGATIANLMFDVSENILLYVGIREDLRKGKLKSKPKGYEVVPRTKKYKHYIPRGLLDEKKDANLLIIDDFADSGDSLMAIVDFLVNDNHFQRDKVKTATIVCTKTAIRNRKKSNFFIYDEKPQDFYFPWGKAR